MRRTLASLGLAAALLLSAGPAFAQGTSANVTVSATVQGGYLNLARVNGSSDLVFPNTEILPSTQTVSASQAPGFTITDATGTGNGWHMTLQCTNYSSGNNSINASNARFTGSAGGGAADDDFTLVHGTSPHWSAGPRDYDNGSQQLHVAAKIATCAAGWGSGEYTWNPTPSKFKLVIPPTTKGGNTTYSSTYTLTLLSGP